MFYVSSLKRLARLDYNYRIQKEFSPGSRASSANYYKNKRITKIWRHFGIRCIIEIIRQADRYYPLFPFDSNLVLSLRYPCPEEPATDALEESKTGTTKSLFRFNCAWVKCSCLPIAGSPIADLSDQGAFSEEFFTKPCFIRIFVPKQFSLRYLQLKHSVKEEFWNDCGGRPKIGLQSDPL